MLPTTSPIETYDAVLLGIVAVLALVAVGNYVVGVYGGAIVASIGCFLATMFLLIDRG